MDERIGSVAAIVLAAGKGTRMKSELPKVLHPLSGTPMIGHVIKSLRTLGIGPICAVIGGQLELLQSYLQHFAPMTLCEQSARLGTGEAVACAGLGFQNVKPPPYAHARHISGPLITQSQVLICAGDTPALDATILRQFITFCLEKSSRLAVLGMRHPKPFGYGRLVCNERGQLMKIVEEKDASPSEKTLNLCNSGVIFADLRYLFGLLQHIKPDNAQKEYYLTDCFDLARRTESPADVFMTDHYEAFDGVNDRQQLVRLEERLQRRAKEKWMLEGVSFRLPETTYIEEGVILGGDVDIGPNCSLLGSTQIGPGSKIGSHVLLKNVIIQAGSTVPPGTVQLQPE